MWAEDAFELRDDARFVDAQGEQLYLLPNTRTDVKAAIRAVERGLVQLKKTAETTTDEGMAEAFRNANRSFARVFQVAYDYDETEVNLYEMPTVGDVRFDLRWTQGSDIPPRTITVEKMRDDLLLSYENGFHATGETIEVPLETTDSRIAEGIYACGRGLSEVHAPYSPSRAEAWRYQPSKCSVSVAAVNGAMLLGVSSTPPNTPMWYRVYNALSQKSSLYARPTFNMDDQTSVIQYLYDKKHGNTD